MIEAEAQPQTEFWEPWQPQIDQRVRVRLSGECRVHWPGLSRPNRLGRQGVSGHLAGEDGKTGFIKPCLDGGGRFPCPNTREVGHQWQVAFDEPLDEDGRTWSGGHYAAIELEPVE